MSLPNSNSPSHAALSMMTRAYERGRIVRAARWQSGLVLVALPFVVTNPSLWLGVSLALSLLAFGAWSLWRGMDWEQGYATGMLAGLIPLGLAAIARPFGHGCEIGGECYSWCMPACACGAALATIVVVKAARSSTHVPTFALSAGVTTLAFGALGCACLSASGAIALLAVYAVSSTPALWWMARQRAATVA